MNALLKDLRFHISIVVVLFTITSLVMYLIRVEDNQNTSLILLIFLAGATGGIINSYIRLRDVPLSQHRDKIDSTSNILAIMQIYVSPLVSGLFALVFYLLCISGLIAGELFPKFTALEEEFRDVAHIFLSVKPAHQLDAIKAVMWGGCYGFF